MMKDQAGFIFLCSDVTESECLGRGLFGGKEKYKSRVKGLEIGAILFTYNYISKRLIGIFEAQTPLLYNIVADAWQGEFPWQVRVHRTEVHKPITREDMGTLLKFDRFGRPTSRLNPEQVSALITLFRDRKRVVQYDDGTRLHCDDGHKVRSIPEQAIDNWLFKNHIVHAYEYPIPEAKRCDFFLPFRNKTGGVYVEYWGKNDKQYLVNKEIKHSIYRTHKLELIDIEAAHPNKAVQDLEEKLRQFRIDL